MGFDGSVILRPQAEESRGKPYFCEILRLRSASAQNDISHLLRDEELHLCL